MFSFYFPGSFEGGILKIVLRVKSGVASEEHYSSLSAEDCSVFFSVFFFYIYFLNTSKKLGQTDG